MHSRALKKRRGSPPPAELKLIREKLGEAGKRFPAHPEVAIDYRHTGELDYILLTPREPRYRMVWLHGGGFRMGSPEVSAGFATHIAATSGCEIALPFYGLSPENPFPGALLDGLAMVRALSNGKPLFLGGDSAGGNLAAVLARRCAPDIRGLLLVSPWLDLQLEAGSYRTNREQDKLFSLASAREASSLYLQGHSPRDPDVSPLLGDLSGMPATLVVVGSTEVLLDDSVELARRLATSHRPVALHVMPGMTHVEPVLNSQSGHSRNTLELARAFMVDMDRP